MLQPDPASSVANDPEREASEVEWDAAKEAEVARRWEAEEAPVAWCHERYPTRLTCCAWCGRRIPGAVTDKTKRGARRDPLWTRAARVACPAHRDLVMALDVYYNGEPHDR